MRIDAPMMNGRVVFVVFLQMSLYMYHNTCFESKQRSYSVTTGLTCTSQLEKLGLDTMLECAALCMMRLNPIDIICKEFRQYLPK